MKKCETLYLLQALESAQLVAASPRGSGVGWDVHSTFAVVLCLWMMHKLCTSVSSCAKCVITIPLCSLRQKSLTSLCLCGTWHINTHLVPELCGRAEMLVWQKADWKAMREGHDQGSGCGWGKWLWPHLCCWKNAPGKPTSAFSSTLWFLGSTCLAKVKCMSDLIRISRYSGSGDSWALCV